MCSIRTSASLFPKASFLLQGVAHSGGCRPKEGLSIRGNVRGRKKNMTPSSHILPIFHPRYQASRVNTWRRVSTTLLPHPTYLRAGGVAEICMFNPMVWRLPWVRVNCDYFPTLRNTFFSFYETQLKGHHSCDASLFRARGPRDLHDITEPTR